MKDILKIAASIDRNLPDSVIRERFCDLLLEEFKTLNGADLVPYLVDFSFDLVSPGTRIILKFPFGCHIFDSDIFERECDGSGKDVRNVI